MRKIQLKGRTRYFLMAGGAALGVFAGVLALSPAAREKLACEAATEVQFSPGGKYRAQKSEKTCHLLQASEPFAVTVDKQDKDGWLVAVPLENDGYVPAASPAIRWKNANALEVTVYSSELSGVLVRHIDNLTVTRRYVRPPKVKGGEEQVAR